MTMAEWLSGFCFSLVNFYYFFHFGNIEDILFLLWSIKCYKIMFRFFFLLLFLDLESLVTTAPVKMHVLSSSSQTLVT